jgi:hypothetical protein
MQTIKMVNKRMNLQLTYKFSWNYNKLKRQLVSFLLIISFFSLTVQSTFAYTTNMEASVVVGQPDFTSSSANQGVSTAANTLSGPRQSIIAEGKLIVNDAGNDRVLIWNTIPTTNNVDADVVVGKSTMTNGIDNGCGGANVLDPADAGILYVQGKLILGDAAHNRLLIFNSIPTTNGASADVVVGQPDFTTCTAGTTANTFGVSDIASDGTKLFIVDPGNNRLLIFNSIPTSNNASADVVVGQTDFTSSSAGTTQSKFSNPRGVAVYNGKLLVGERGNFRITIFNTIPTANGTSADVVLGQTNFTTATSSPPSTASTVHPFFMSTDNKGRIYVADRNSSRYLIWNSIPSSNNTLADIVIGQPDFTSTTVNNGGVSARSVGNAKGIFANESYMVISDQGNNRVLIFDNLIKKPGITLNNAPEGRDGGLVRLRGTARVDSPYIVQSLQYAVNGGGYANATATDGSYSSTSEDFYFDFDPKSNNYSEDGYTVRIKSSNNNTDVTDQLFYFSPFTSNSPSNNSFTTNQLPTFEFTVNKGRFQDLKDNVSKFQVMINKDNSGWQTYIDTVPVSYEAVKGDGENIYRTGDNTTNGNGTYEDKKVWVNYSNNNSTIKVYAKGVDNTGNVTDAYFENGGKKLSSGSYQWKIVAVDKAGHTQETDSKYLRVNTTRIISSQGFFPLAVLNISGLGNPDMSTTNLTGMKSSYSVSSPNPIFYGIANVNSKVTLELTDKACSEKGESDCVKTYETTTNPESRFGINIPVQTLHSGKIYSTRVFVSHENDYNELPTFSLHIQ